MKIARTAGAMAVALACIMAAPVAYGAEPASKEFKEVPLYPTPLDFELGPAVQFGGPHPFPVSFGGRFGMLARVHRLFSFGFDMTYTQTAAREKIFNAPVGGSHWRITTRICTHASVMFFCMAAGMAGMTTLSSDNVPRSSFPTDVHFIPMIDIGASWTITPYIKFRPLLETGAMLGVPVTIVNDRPDQIYEPFPLLATFSLNFAFAVPSTLRTEQGPQ